MSRVLLARYTICCRLIVTALVVALPAGISLGCGACFRLPYESLLEKVLRWDQVVVAHPVDTFGSSWKIDRVIRGKDLDNKELLHVITASEGSVSTLGGDQILRWDEYGKTWLAVCPVDGDLVRFLAGARALSPSDREPLPVRHQAQRLRYFLPYLEHADPQIADSAHAALANAPYAVLTELAADLDRDRLLTWIEDQSIAINKRVPLYITLLGICGDQSDAASLQRRIDLNQAGGGSGYLAALLTAHIELNGEGAVRFIEESYLRNHDRTLGEVVAAVDALRTHGEAKTIVARERIIASLQMLLRERAPLAELVIDDFARWQNWSIAPRLMEIYTEGQQPWNNALIIRYMEACPLPEAKKFCKSLLRDAEPGAELVETR